jgi:hypothetical protein
MAAKKPTEPSPESIARANRRRLDQEDGARAIAEVERNALAVRKNMHRLRALREAREAEQPAQPPASTSKRTKARGISEKQSNDA